MQEKFSRYFFFKNVFLKNHQSRVNIYMAKNERIRMLLHKSIQSIVVQFPIGWNMA